MQISDSQPRGVKVHGTDVPGVSQARSLPVFLCCLSTLIVGGSLSAALEKPGLAELDPDLQD